MTMNAFDRFPAHLHWTAQQLADAVPLRLHELPAFRADAGVVAPAANAPRRTAPRPAIGYRAVAPLVSRFRVR